VGSPLFKVRSGEATTRRKPATKENPGTPTLTRRPTTGRLRLPRHPSEPRRFEVGFSTVTSVCGSRQISNDELLTPHRGVMSSSHTTDDIVRLTGIESRPWVASDEDAVNLAVRACWELLDREGIQPTDLDVLICSTTSPTRVAPSMACLVLNELARGKSGALSQAYDIHAACSGYLYALQSGYDYLQSDPNGRVLVVTTEVMSPLLDPGDFDTVVLFGDAASATMLYGENHLAKSRVRLHRPELSTKGDIEAALSVPLPNSGFIQMKGHRVFSEAVRAMIFSLNRACQREGIDVGNLDLIVPHQANQRILDAIQSRVEPRVFSNIRNHGNTSSSSIPLCLSEILPESRQGDQLGLCAFGGGFTFGASILKAV
jgi:2-oxoisovalerate dehydrogenase E1 component